MGLRELIHLSGEAALKIALLPFRKEGLVGSNYSFLLKQTFQNGLGVQEIRKLSPM